MSSPTTRRSTAGGQRRRGVARETPASCCSEWTSYVIVNEKAHNERMSSPTTRRSTVGCQRRRGVARGTPASCCIEDVRRSTPRHVIISFSAYAMLSLAAVLQGRWQFLLRCQDMQSQRSGARMSHFERHRQRGIKGVRHAKHLDRGGCLV